MKHNDFDVLVFGANKLVTKKSKKMYLYNLPDILDQHKICFKDFIKIGVILGCDFAPKTPKIGVKTVMKKYKAVELTSIQEQAYNYFLKNYDKKICVEEKKNNIDNLIEFLVEKGFNKKAISSIVKIIDA